VLQINVNYEKVKLEFFCVCLWYPRDKRPQSTALYRPLYPGSQIYTSFLFDTVETAAELLKGSNCASDKERALPSVCEIINYSSAMLTF
jgi:hypothetical protein